MNAHLYSILSLCVWEYLHLLCCDLELNDALLLWNHFKGMVGPRVWQSLYIQDNWTASRTNILIRTPSFWNNLKDYKDLKYKAGKACSWAIWMWQVCFSHCSFLQHGNSSSLKSYPIWRHKKQFNFHGRIQSFNSCAYFLWGNLGSKTYD